MQWNGFDLNEYEDTDPSAFLAAVDRQRERADALKSRMGPDVARAEAMGDAAWKARTEAFITALTAYLARLETLATWPGNGRVPIIPPMPEF